MNRKNKYGQYMTPHFIAEFMVNLITHDKNSNCLEPSCGDGVFLQELEKQKFLNITGIEIDKSLIQNKYNVINKSFITYNFPQKYDVIIGNPPYIRWKNLEEELKIELNLSEEWKNYCNSLCDYSSAFILKSVNLLNENGELIFITTDYWFSTTHAKNIRNYLLKQGYFEEIFYFNETPIFEKVTASFVIFKFIKSSTKEKPNIKITKYLSKKKLSPKDLIDLKNKKSDKIQYFELNQFQIDTKWILITDKDKQIAQQYEKSCNKVILKDICNIGNGMVSGLDKAFQIPNDINLNVEEKENSISVIKAKNIEPFSFLDSTRYIFMKDVIDENLFKNKFNNFFQLLSSFKTKLLERYNYGKNLNYWEWAFLRNLSLFKMKSDKIFCPCKERITHKNRFRFAIVPADYYPTQDVTALILKNQVKEDIRYIAALLNSKYVFQWLNINGIKKGDIIEFSEAPLNSIPYREIDFSDNNEKEIHNRIVLLVESYKREKNEKILEDIDACIKELL